MTPEEMKGLVEQFLQARLRDNKPWQLHAMLSDFGFWVEAYEREAVVGLLKGIDQTEIESKDGYWETSAGADFGKEILSKIRARGQ